MRMGKLGNYRRCLRSKGEGERRYGGSECSFLFCLLFRIRELKGLLYTFPGMGIFARSWLFNISPFLQFGIK